MVAAAAAAAAVAADAAAAAPSSVSSAGLLPFESPAEIWWQLAVWPRCPNQTAWPGAAGPAARPAAAAASGALAAGVAAAEGLRSKGNELNWCIETKTLLVLEPPNTLYLLPRLPFSLLFQFLDLGQRQGALSLVYSVDRLLTPL